MHTVNYRGYTVALNGNEWAFRAHSWQAWSPPYASLHVVKAAIDAELAEQSVSVALERRELVLALRDVVACLHACPMPGDAILALSRAQAIKRAQDILARTLDVEG